MTDLDVAATARRLGVSERTIRRWLASGRLPGYRVGARIRIPELAIREAVAPYGAGEPATTVRPDVASGTPATDRLARYLSDPERRRERARQAAWAIDRIRLDQSRPARDASETAEALVREERDGRDRQREGIVDRGRP